MAQADGDDDDADLPEYLRAAIREDERERERRAQVIPQPLSNPYLGLYLSLPSPYLCRRAGDTQVLVPVRPAPRLHRHDDSMPLLTLMQGHGQPPYVASVASVAGDSRLSAGSALSATYASQGKTLPAGARPPAAHHLTLTVQSTLHKVTSPFTDVPLTSLLRCPSRVPASRPFSTFRVSVCHASPGACRR